MNDCWIYAGTFNKDNYGVVWNKFAHTYELAHRLVYEAFEKNLNSDLVLDHICRTPACINPDHLEQVTNKVNVLRGQGITAKNAQKTHCPRGHEYKGDNLYVTLQGYRHCKSCRKIAIKKYKENK